MVVSNENVPLRRMTCSYLNREVNYANSHDFKLKVNPTGASADKTTTQSPINLVTKDCHRLPPPIQLCLCNHFERRPMTVKFENNGYTVMVTLPDLVKKLKLKGGPLKDEFVFDQLHFHWGEGDNDGSEHSVDGVKYAGEVHLVHYNTKYPSFNVAKDYDDGLAVIGVFLEIAECDNIKLDPITTALYKIACRGSSYCYTSRCFFDWLEEANLNEYYNYMGSLTTIPYSETVFWMVMVNPIPISRAQMEIFRNVHIYDGLNKRIKNNVRETHVPPPKLKMKFTGKLKMKAKL